jgi:hypothetical protein
VCQRTERLGRKGYNYTVDGGSQNRLIVCWLGKTGMRICLRSEEKTPTLISAKTFLRRLIMNHLQKHFSACLIALAALFSTAWAQAVTAPTLSTTTSSFGAWGETGVTCDTPPVTPVPTVNGYVGTSGTVYTLVTGFPPPSSPSGSCTLLGTVQINATTVKDELFTPTTGLYSQLLNTPCPADTALTVHNLSGELGGKTLPPGVYCISGVATLNAGTLTLDPAATGGDGGTVWIFAGGSITTAGTAAVRSKVVMAPGGNMCNVYWALSSTLTLSLTDFVGNVLAGTAITFTGSSLAGRAFGQSDVTMTAGSSITSCGAAGGGNGNGDGNDKDKDHHDKDHHDKDKDHKDDSHHSFKDGGNPFDKDEHGDKK